MPTGITYRPLLFALGLGLLTGWGSDCRAASMYTVTDFGPGNSPGGSIPNPQWDEAQAQHPSLGLTLSDAERAALPWVTALQRPGVPGPQDIPIQMTALQNTESGIALGVAPVGILYAAGSENAFGYTQKQADGTFGPFVPLAIENARDPFNGMASLDPQGHIREADASGQLVPLVFANTFYPLLGVASLDARGHILISNGLGQNLIDVNTGMRTDLASLFPLGTLGRDGRIDFATLAADGTIFAEVGSKTGTLPDGSYNHLLMLTPPLSTPEPSSLAAFAVLVVGLAVTRGRLKGRVDRYKGVRSR